MKRTAFGRCTPPDLGEYRIHFGVFDQHGSAGRQGAGDLGVVGERDRHVRHARLLERRRDRRRHRVSIAIGENHRAMANAERPSDSASEHAIDLRCRELVGDVAQHLREPPVCGRRVPGALRFPQRIPQYLACVR